MVLLSVLVAPAAARLATADEAKQAAPSQVIPVTAPVSDDLAVTVVRVKAPWYAVDFLLFSQFRKAVPTYRQVAGLRFKAFASTTTKDGNYFGGIYLWDSAKQARNWYTPDWFAEVERKRGHKPTVDYYAVVNDTAFVEPAYDYRQGEGDCVTVFVHAVSPALGRECQAAQPGLLRTYVVREHSGEERAFLLFTSAVNAMAFLRSRQISKYEWFKTPVLLNNVKPT